MNAKQFYADLISLGIAAVLVLFDLTMIKVSLSDVPLSTMTVYPAALFALLGVLLVYHGLKPSSVE